MDPLSERTGKDFVQRGDVTQMEPARAGMVAGPARTTRPAPARPEYSLLRREGAWRDALRRRMLALADMLAFVAATGVAVAAEGQAALWALALLPVLIFLAKGHGLYDQDHVRIRHLTVDESGRLFYWVTLSVAGVALLFAFLPDPALSALTGVGMWATMLVAAFMLRAAARLAWRRFTPPERGLIIGEGELALAVRRDLLLEPGHHIDLLPTVEARPSNGAKGTFDPENLDEMLEDMGLDRLILALPDLDEPALSASVAACRARGVKLSVAPPMRGMLGTAVDLTHLAELPVIEYRTWDASRSTMALKRAVDMTIAAIGLILLAPLFLAIAVAVRLDSRGSALFMQWRGGQSGKPFRMFKFRTMVHNAEELIAEVVAIDRLHEPMFKVRDDPRVTRLGAFLRRTSLDELPQLLNVLFGDMSLVGPRPEETWLVERYSEAVRFRLNMRPGMTGPMQIHGRGELNFQERLAVEREYVENYSFWKDLRILVRTVSVVLRGDGAF
jgi:exopolysaccharide biosynthesis polyprenyl glycosylphosphotransferase